MIWIVLELTLVFIFAKENIRFNSLVATDTEGTRLLTLVFITRLITSIIMYKESVDKRTEKLNFIIISLLMMSTLLFLSRTLLILILCIEMTAIPLIWAIVNYSNKQDKVISANLYVIWNILGSIPFLYFTVTELNFDLIVLAVQGDSNTRSLLRLICLTGIIIKTPLILAHVWLTSAHVSASGTCSIILAAILIKIGTWGIFKFGIIMGNIRVELSRFLIALGRVTIVIIRVLIIRYKDVKIIIAVSSVLHMGLIIPIIFLGTLTSNTSIVIIIVSHGVASLYLFYLVTIEYEIRGQRTKIANKQGKSRIQCFPWIKIKLILMNIGIPITLNFLRELKTYLRVTSIRKTIAILLTLYLLLAIYVPYSVLRTQKFGKSPEKKKDPFPPICTIVLRSSTPINILVLMSFYYPYSLIKTL